MRSLAILTNLILFCKLALAAPNMQPNEVLWTMALGTYSCPAVGQNSNIYICVGSRLHAVNPHGTNEWSFQAGGSCSGSPAVGHDGTIFFGAGDGKVYAVNPDGTEKWSFTTGNTILSSPSIGMDGTIYVGSTDGNFYALNPTGSQRWAFAAGNISRASPAIGTDGTIYFGTVEGKFIALKNDGLKKWELNVNRPIETSPSIALDGTLFFTAGPLAMPPSVLFAVGPGGVELWRNQTNGFLTSAVIGRDGIIYIGSGGQQIRLNAVNPSNGQVMWSAGGGSLLRTYVPSAPVIAEGGMIYFGGGPDDSGISLFYCFNSDGTTNWQFSEREHGNRWR